MRINTNTSAINAQRNLTVTQNAVSSSMSKLSSGFRINRASDDAAGLGIANKLRGDLRSLKQASRNAEQANAMLQIAEGGTQTIGNILDRMKELAAQAASSNSGDRAQLQAEFTTLREEITRTVDTTTYQGSKLINGTLGNRFDATLAGSTLDSNAAVQSSTIKGGGAKAATYTLAKVSATSISLSDGAGNVETVTVGSTGTQSVNFARFGISFSTSSSFDISGTNNSFSANAGIQVAAGTNSAEFLVSSSGDYAAQDRVTLSTAVNLGTGATGLNIATTDISSQSGAQTALTSLDSAIGTVNSALGTIGAAQNRIDFASANVRTTIENMSAAESTIRDLDMADEMVNFSKQQILAQAGTAMLAQANQMGQGVLQLLRG